VLQLFPFVVYLAPITSLVLLVMLASAGELRLGAGLVLGAIFAVGAYCQFLGGSAIVAALGLGLQTLLAIYLIVRWRSAHDPRPVSDDR
jgi:hypothetical protein